MKLSLVRRTLEAVCIFIGMPLLFYWKLVPVPKIPALLAVMLYCLVILWRDDSFELNRLWNPAPAPKLMQGLALRSLLVAAAAIGLVCFIRPNQLFSFPINRPWVWLLVMGLYPLLSVVPQELIYRTYFFHRYRSLILSERAMMLASAAAFAFLHIVYDNIWAPVLTFIGGLLFAHTYRRTKSLLWVSIEHAVYGCIIFTVGLGYLFYESF